MVGHTRQKLHILYPEEAVQPGVEFVGYAMGKPTRLHTLLVALVALDGRGGARRPLRRGLH